MPDYLNQILARLSAFIARMSGGALVRCERLTPAEILARLSFVDRLVLLVAAIQVVLFVLAVLIEFSVRKRRRVRELEHRGPASVGDPARSRPAEEMPPRDRAARAPFRSERALPVAPASLAGSPAEPAAEPALSSPRRLRRRSNRARTGRAAAGRGGRAEGARANRTWDSAGRARICSRVFAPR